MVAFSSGCGSLAVDPSDRPALSESRQQAPAPPESPVLANLRSAEWAQAHGLPVNPHRGGGPSITFYGPGGAIRRHVELNESDLRPRGSFRVANASAPRSSRFGFLDAAAPALLVREGELTDSIVIVGSTKHYMVFEDGELIAKSILVIDADTVVGASQLAYDELGELAAEAWVPRSVMGPIDDPEDPQWEMSFPSSPVGGSMGTFLASCEQYVSSDNCADALLSLGVAAVIAAGSGALCAKFPITCWLARNRAKALVIAAAYAIYACREWETHYPALPGLSEKRSLAESGMRAPRAFA